MPTRMTTTLSILSSFIRLFSDNVVESSSAAILCVTAVERNSCGVIALMMWVLSVLMTTLFQENFIPSLHLKPIVEGIADKCSSGEILENFENFTFFMSSDKNRITNQPNKICNIKYFKENECVENNMDPKEIAIQTICEANSYILDKWTSPNKFMKTLRSIWNMAKAQSTMRPPKSCVKINDGYFFMKTSDCDPDFSAVWSYCIIAWKLHVLQGNVIPGECGNKVRILEA